MSPGINGAMEIPVDRKRERNAFRASLIALDRSRRNLIRKVQAYDLDDVGKKR